jgi:hypothetical protein
MSAAISMKNPEFSRNSLIVVSLFVLAAASPGPVAIPDRLSALSGYCFSG